MREETPEESEAVLPYSGHHPQKRLVVFPFYQHSSF
jgi:hypothetical protein